MPSSPASLAASQRERLRVGGPFEEALAAAFVEPAGSIEGGAGAGAGAGGGPGGGPGGGRGGGGRATPVVRTRFGDTSKIFNFETGRNITVGGSTYKRLLRQ